MLKGLINRFIENKKSFILKGLAFFVIYFLFSDLALAEWSSVFWTLLDFLARFSAFIISIFAILSWWFLSPEWITWDIDFVNIRGVIENLWVMVSNIVYLIFWFILVWIAFANIVWLEGEEYALKQALPKFIVWVLIVPLSLFFVNFILSMSAILTTAVISSPWFLIPNDALSRMSMPIWVNLYYDKSWGDQFYVEWNDKITWEELFSEIPFSLVSIYVYSVFDFSNLSQYFSSWEIDFSTVTSILSQWVKVVFNIILVVIYIVLLAWLSLTLFARIVMVWLYTILSPLAWLAYFFSWKWWEDTPLQNFSFKEFIGLAMFPVYCSAALAFWMIFLSWIWNTERYSENTDVSVTQDWNTTNIEYWDFSLKANLWDFSIWWKWDWSNPFWVIIMYLFSIVVLWIALVTAMKSNSITSAIAEPIDKLWQNIWWAVAQLPENVPIIPWLPWIKSFERISEVPKDALQSISSKQSSKLEESINNLFGQNVLSTQELNRFKQKMNVLREGDIEKTRDYLFDAAAKYWLRDPKIQRMIELFGKTIDTKYWNTVFTSWFGWWELIDENGKPTDKYKKFLTNTNSKWEAISKYNLLKTPWSGVKLWWTWSIDSIKDLVKALQANKVWYDTVKEFWIKDESELYDEIKTSIEGDKIFPYQLFKKKGSSDNYVVQFVSKWNVMSEFAITKSSLERFDRDDFIKNISTILNSKDDDSIDLMLASVSEITWNTWLKASDLKKALKDFETK